MEQPLSRKNQYISVIILGVCFLLMFTAFNSLQNMISSIYEQMGFGTLGLISVFCIYGTFGVGTFFSAYVIERMSYRKLMFLCSLGYFLFNMTGVYVSECEGHLTGICSEWLVYVVVIIFALLTGVCASFIWVAQAAYVSEVATPTTKGQLFGLFWGLMMASQILGNILGTFILGEISNLVYFIVLGILGLAGAALFFAVRPTGKSNNMKEKKSLSQGFREMKELIFEPGASSLLLYYTFAGVTIACYTGFIYKLINRSYKKSEGESEEEYEKSLKFHTGLVFIALGISQSLTGFIMNRVGDKFNKYKMASFGTLIVECAIICSFLCYFLQSYPLCFVVSILWGGSQAYLQSNTGALISSEYEGKVAAFSVFRLFFAIGTTVMMAVNIIFTATHVPDWVFLVIVAIYQMIVTIASEGLEKRAQQRNKLSMLTEQAY